MRRNDDEEKDIEIPSEENENVGSEVSQKKKRRKSKEERVAERKIIFWTLIIILVITIGFWLVPKIGQIWRGELPKIYTEKNQANVKDNEKKTETEKTKNYVEITL